MGRRLTAVYDSDPEYIKRFLDYAEDHHFRWIELIGFTDLKALKKYLDKNKIGLLLFSMEEMIGQNRGFEETERECENFAAHKNTELFVYLGERRNSKSVVEHIHKYQPASRIFAELRELLFSEEAEEAEGRPASDGPELLGIYSPGQDAGTLQVALDTAEAASARKEVLLIDMDRFSLLPEIAGVSPDCSLSDLIYFYRTNPLRLKEGLLEKRKRYESIDVLRGPEDMEDLEELKEKDWPDFLKTLADAGGYETIVIHLGEAFRNQESIFDLCSSIYTPLAENEESRQKMYKFAQYYCSNGRRDIYEKTVVVPV